MGVGTFFSEVGVLVVATIAIALLTWGVAFCRWKPHLSVDQSVSWRWVNDDTFCITVDVRYRNTSSYRKILVTEMWVELQRLAPLTLREATEAEFSGGKRQYLPELARPYKQRKWDKRNAPVVEPGESDTEVFVFFLPKDDADDLRSFVAYSFIHEQRNKKVRGWQVASCHNIQACLADQEEVPRV